MNNIDQAISELKKTLHNEKLIQEYLSLKNIVDNSLELKKMREEILALNKKNEMGLMKALKDKYDSHPLVINFNNVKEEVNELLNEIKREIEHLWFM